MTRPLTTTMMRWSPYPPMEPRTLLQVDRAAHLDLQEDRRGHLVLQVPQEHQDHPQEHQEHLQGHLEHLQEHQERLVEPQEC